MIYILAIVALVGCAREELNLRIDVACTGGQSVAAARAVNEINDLWYDCHDGDGITITGEVTITDYLSVDDPETSAHGDDDDWFVCVPEGNPLEAEYSTTVNGMGAYGGNVIIFQSRLSEDMFRLVSMHELGHYIGLDDSDDPESIMFWGSISPSAGFTADDVAAMCDL